MNVGAAFERNVFERASDDIARDLVGSLLVLHDENATWHAIVVETEAYGGGDDPASHAFRGPTKRSEIMFGLAGFLYVYRIYGLHWCMNVVTGVAGDAGAVLLRGAELLPISNDGSKGTSMYLRGPGNLTKGLGITGADNGLDCCGGSERWITFHKSMLDDENRIVGVSPRIGISVAQERPSRYFLDGHPAVSKPSAITRRR